ncbi:hypothetical protein ACHAXT_010028 [Thalassiosira profunda]
MAAPIMIAAAFSSFEDFSSRMVLLPRHDDEGTGAKVASHDPVEISKVENPSPGGGAAQPAAAGGEEASPKGVSSSSNAENDGACESELGKAKNEQHSREVPVGYVLVKIISDSEGNNASDGAPYDLEEDTEFADILSFLRHASFPVALVFAHPNDTPQNDEQGDGKGEGGSVSSLDTKSSSGPLDVEEELSEDETAEKGEGAQSLAALSREDAQKYAQQAATELRGRLSRWGHQAAARAADAATRAADAAAHVKELRKNEGDGQEGESSVVAEGGGKSAQTASAEKSLPQDAPVGAADESPSNEPGLEAPCFLFLQAPTGFEQLPGNDSAACPHITNNSVVSVRLSQESACPLGKNGYTFQWYRSEGSESEGEPSWLLLRGACHPSYQPNVTDAGHILRCVIKQEESHQTCHLPCIVRVEQSLFDSVAKTLLGGESIVFGNLRRVEDQTSCSVKVDVCSDDDFITSSSISIDGAANGSDGESSEVEPVSHFRGIADPSKPKLLDLVSSAHGRLRLEAANRKARETLLIALGIANYSGKLASLTAETTLFHCDETEIDLGAESGLEKPSDLHTKQLDAKLAEFQRLLESKDVAITKLQKELVTSDAASQKVQKDLETCRKSEAGAKEELEKCHKTLEENKGTIEDMKRARADMEKVHERTVKALHNDKAVLSSTIEARDGKIEALSSRNAELERQALAQSEELSTVETLKSNLVQTQEKCTTVERVLSQMKETESELQKDLKNAKGIVTDLNEKFLQAKDTANRCETDCKKLKLERNSLKSKADGLSKEMMRLNKGKNNADSEAMESVRYKMDLQKSKQESEKQREEIERLRQENVNLRKLKEENESLQEQVEIAQSERKDAVGQLEAVSMAHEQSVSKIDTVGHGDTASELRVSELECIITNITEHLAAKDMQLDTLKEINAQLLDELNQRSS